MSKQTRYEYALIDVNEGFEYETVKIRTVARDKKRSWNKAYPDAPVMIVQRKFKLGTERKVR